MQTGLSVSWKLCLNLCSQRCLSPGRSLVSNFTPIGFWQPKILFSVGFMNLGFFYLKMLSVSKLQMLETNVFHSIMVDGKYEFFKNWCFTLIWRIFCAFLVLNWQFDCGIISKRFFWHRFLYILKKQHCFLHQCPSWRDFKPSSWQIFSLNVPLNAPVIAKAALYCRDSFFWWKELSKAWS